MSPKLLLADDSPTIQRVIELTFAGEDVQVIAVCDGSQAIEKVQAEWPDIVLADVGMPERDGYAVAAFIKGHQQFAHIPVLLLTGAFEPLDEARARAVGCDGVLVKPFEPQMVINRVRALLAAPRDQSLVHASDAMRASVPPANARAPDESLDDYFDRIDAAFASTTWAATETDEAAGRRLSEGQGLQSAVTSDSALRSSSAAPASDRALSLAESQADSTDSSLSDAFAALLTAEQGRPIAPSRALVISDYMIDEIARRIVARMGDEEMRRAILEVAERLVKEEIERIKGR
jgi:CheY-like chemotaxis protein